MGTWSQPGYFQCCERKNYLRCPFPWCRSAVRNCRCRRRGAAMKSLQEYLDDAAVAHGHLCAGQVLGVRMAMLGLKKLGLEDPQGKDRKRIVTFVEIDRCATDAVMVVTGCRLGKRALK